MFTDLLTILKIKRLKIKYLDDYSKVSYESALFNVTLDNNVD